MDATLETKGVPLINSAEWYCIRSTAGYETRAAELLNHVIPNTFESTGTIEAFCPQISKTMSVGGKRRRVLRALFPGYFFAHFELSRAARYVSSRPGVIGLVRFGDQATPIPAAVIDELKALDLEDLSECLLLFNFAPGQRLRIDSGPFAGMEAQFVANLPDGNRAVLLLEYLNREVSVITDRSILRSAA